MSTRSSPDGVSRLADRAGVQLRPGRAHRAAPRRRRAPHRAFQRRLHLVRRVFGIPPCAAGPALLSQCASYPSLNTHPPTPSRLASLRALAPPTSSRLHPRRGYGSAGATRERACALYRYRGGAMRTEHIQRCLVHRVHRVNSPSQACCLPSLTPPARFYPAGGRGADSHGGWEPAGGSALLGPVAARGGSVGRARE